MARKKDQLVEWHVEIDPEFRRLLEKEAELCHVSVSALMRVIIGNYLVKKGLVEL
jgi:hypothetical protein